MALTPAGLGDLLLTDRVDFLLVDEIDKADVAVLQHFLPLAENNMLRIIKANKSAEVKIKKLIGTANVKRKTQVWNALQNRMVIIKFENPSAEELKEIVKREVPNVPEEFFQQVDSTRLSIRQTVMLASVATVNLNVALKLYKTLLKYSS